jgi:hypothetical protein
VEDLGVNNNACKWRKKIKDRIILDNTLQNIAKTTGILSNANNTQSLSLFCLDGFQETIATSWNSTWDVDRFRRLILSLQATRADKMELPYSWQCKEQDGNIKRADLTIWQEPRRIGPYYRVEPPTQAAKNHL